MNKDEIKNLARLTYQKRKLDKSLSNLILNKLSRGQLMLYLRYLKALVAKDTIKIMSQKPISVELKKSLERRFVDKNIIYEKADIGDGIVVKLNDTIIDLSLAGYLENTIDSLKQELS